MKINFFSEKKKTKKISKQLQFNLKKILNNGFYTNSRYVHEFESKFKKYFNAKYCVAVNSGTSALHLSLISLNIGKGDEVIVPSLTFIATAAVINYVGAKPVFADVNNDDWLINSENIKKLINKKTKAILVVHLHGLMCDMKEIKKIAKKYKLKVIEDAAQAHGSKLNNKSPGYYSDVAAFSFYPTKNLGAIGEGGALLTNDRKIYEKTKRMRAWSHKKNKFHEISFNYRMSEFIAVSLILKMKFLKQDIKKRIKIAEIYKKNLNIQTYSKFKNNKKHSYHIFAIRLKNRKLIAKKLEKHGIQTNMHYPYSLSLLKEFKLKKNNNKTPKANKISKDILSLPIYPDLNFKKVVYTANVLNSILNKN